MMIALHKRARTTPAIRAEIAASTESAKALACRFGVSEATIYKWKSRQSVQDRSHTAHRLQTTLTSAQETIVVHLRRTLLLPLDDLLAVTREFLCPDVSRSGLDRCLRRHGVGNLHALKPATPQEPHKAFKSYEPGYLHMDVKYLPQMQDETKRRYLFVAIDRATRWVFVAIKKDKTAASAGSFLKALHKACPLKIVKLLTDNGKEFTDRLFASRERAPSGNHEFDQLCQELGIEHRLTRPRTPKTNGMVERFNGRISDVLKTNRFNSALDLEETLLRYVALYNHQLPQSALQSKTPMQAMKGWYDSQPSLFHKRPYDRPGCDTYCPPNATVDDCCKNWQIASALLSVHFDLALITRALPRLIHKPMKLCIDKMLSKRGSCPCSPVVRPLLTTEAVVPSPESNVGIVPRMDIQLSSPLAFTGPNLAPLERRRTALSVKPPAQPTSA